MKEIEGKIQERGTEKERERVKERETRKQIITICV